MNRLQDFLSRFPLLVLLAALGLTNPVVAAPVCSPINVDQMYGQLQQGMTLSQVTSLFGASGYESGQGLSGVSYSFLGAYAAYSDPAGSGRVNVIAGFPSTTATAAISYKSAGYYANSPTGSVPLAAYQSINGSSTLVQIQGLLGASGVETFNSFGSSFTQLWRYADGNISASFSYAIQGISFKSMSRSSATQPTLSATQVNQIAVGMTLPQVEAIIGALASSTSVSYGSGGSVISQSAYWYDGKGGSVFVTLDASGAVSSKPSFTASVSTPSWQVADAQVAYQAVSPGMSYAQVTAAVASMVALPATLPGTAISLQGTGAYVYLYFNGTNSALSQKSLSLSNNCSAATSAVTVSSLNFSPPATLQSGGRVSLSAAATYSNATSKTVSPTWSSSNSAVASVSSTGTLTAGIVSADTAVTLTATYTDNGVTVSASRTLTITAAPASLSGLTLTGPSIIQSGGQALFKAVATYSDGSTRAVLPTSWSFSSPNLGSAFGSVNTSRGVVTVGTVTSNTALTVTGNYTEGALTKSGSVTLTITAAPATLSSLTLIGGRGTMAGGETLSFSAEGVYSDGSRKQLSATWGVSNTTAAGISSTGVMTANSVTQNTPVLVSASATQSGVTVSAQYQVVVGPSAGPSPPPPPPLQVAVEATGIKTAYSLKLWLNSDLQAKFAASTRYNVYVVAVVSGSTPLLVLLDRNSEWKLLSFPMSEYLSGVDQGSWQLVELLDKLDVSMISGTQIYVGYGTSDQEMLSAQRYRLAYQLP